MTERRLETRVSDGEDTLSITITGRDDILVLIEQQVRAVVGGYREAANPIVIINGGSPCEGCPG
jgi:hypothetical protein